MNWVKAALCLGAMGVSNQLLAVVGKDNVRHGTIPGRTPELAVNSGTIVTLQHANDTRIHDEGLASVDIIATLLTRNGRWLLYVEGNTSPHQRGVSTLLPEANQDAGTAVDRDDKGRLQVSELNYLWDLGEYALAVGMVNPAGPIDNSDVANNEASQFLAKTLVNNPSIAFPDYSLGMVYFYKPASHKLDITFMLTSSNGLGNNPDKSYSELMDVTAAGKGMFAVTELVWKQSWHIWRVGAWMQTADNAYLDGSGNTANNYGLYLSSDHQFGQHRLNVRLGLANPQVSEAAQFIGFAVDHPVGTNHAGIGYTKTFVSNDAGPDTADRSQYEAYFRFDLDSRLTVTPSVQRIQNSHFNNSGAISNSDVNVYSVRTSYNF
jgi:porin